MYSALNLVIQDPPKDNGGVVDYKALQKAGLEHPDMLARLVTMTSPQNMRKQFPLLAMTEGANNPHGVMSKDVWGAKSKSRGISSTTFEYEFSGAPISKSAVQRVLSPLTQLGRNYADIEIVFRDFFATEQEIVKSPSGLQCRVQSRTPVPGGHKYVLRLHGAVTPDTYLQPSDYANNALWVGLGFKPAAMSLSRGNESKTYFNGKATGMIGLYRDSFHQGGNIANKVVKMSCTEETEDGTRNRVLYMPQYEHQFMMRWREAKEALLWFSEYNRQSNGMIMDIDNNNGYEIPSTAGMFQRMRNRIGHNGRSLSIARFKSIVYDLFNGENFLTHDVVAFGGLKGLDVIRKTIEAMGFMALAVQGGTVKPLVANGTGFTLNEPIITEYVDPISQNKITLKHLPFLDSKRYATEYYQGFPVESYRVCIVDNGLVAETGEQNIQLLHEKDRLELRGVVKGMSQLNGQNWNSNPTGWELGNLQQIATDKDESSVHFLGTAGLHIQQDFNFYQLDLY